MSNHQSKDYSSISTEYEGGGDGDNEDKDKAVE